MGSIFTRRSRRWRGSDYRAEEGQTGNKRTEMAANQPEETSDGHKMLLHNPDDPENGVYYGVDVEKKDGRFVLNNILEDGLAYKTGFRSSDVLVMANSIDIDDVDMMQLLKMLLHYKERNYLIGVERKLDDGTKTFIWKIFKITTKDGVPDVVVLQTLESDRNVIPDIVIYPSTPTYDFLRVTSRAYNIFIDEDGQPTKYLSISDDKQLVFQSYNESSEFYQYNYSDPEPRNGEVVAYSTRRISGKDTDDGLDSDSNSSDQPEDCEDVNGENIGTEKKQKKTSPATKDKKTTTVMGFTKRMIGKNIPPDPRFWYLRAVDGGVSLQSMIEKGMYLGCGSDDKAILSKTETKLQLSRDEEHESNSAE